MAHFLMLLHLSSCLFLIFLFLSYKTDFKNFVEVILELFYHSHHLYALVYLRIQVVKKVLHKLQ